MTLAYLPTASACSEDEDAMNQSASFHVTRVVRSEGGCRFRLEDDTLALQACSCLLTPRPGDTILVVVTESEAYISQVLKTSSADACLSVPGAEHLTLAQRSLALHGTDNVSVRSLGEVELTSADAGVTVSARNFIASASESMVQNAQNLISHAQHCVVQVSSLLRLHGKQTLVTSEQDMKLDAERISLG